MDRAELRLDISRMLISSFGCHQMGLAVMITPTDREGTMLLDLVPDGLRHHQPGPLRHHSIIGRNWTLNII
jgi:hypothetical protein